MTAILEYWRPVPGYDGLYEVSDQGSVRSLNYHQTGKRRELKGRKVSVGYEQVILCRDGVQKNKLVHRLVYEAFNGTIPEGLQIDHINGVKNDNRLVNLRCVTPRENIKNPVTRKRYLEANKRLCQDPKWREAVREANKRKAQDAKWVEAHRKAMKRLSKDQKWQEAHRERMRKAHIKPVLQIDKDSGAVIREWECMRDIERELGIRHSSVSACCNGKQNTAGGFKWQYVDYHYSS